jgi:hypothetical protein
MELRYEKAMKEYNLSYSELPEDAKDGISDIKDVLKGIAMLEKKGKKITPRTMGKLKRMDKWVYFEILDHVHDTENNDDEMPEDAEEVIEEMNEEAEVANESTQISEEDKVGYEVDAELKKMFDSGKKEWSIDEVKSAAKKTYNILFDTYEEDAENGIKTSNYSLLETGEQTFVISKN